MTTTGTRHGGLRPEDINNLVRDLVQRHSGHGTMPVDQSSRDQVTAPLDEPAATRKDQHSMHSELAAGSAQVPQSSDVPHDRAYSQGTYHQLPGRPDHQHWEQGMGGYPAEARGRRHPPSVLPEALRDYDYLREPLFAPHGGFHPGMAQIQRPVHSGHLGPYAPSQYLDGAMMEEYSYKMQMLQHDFDVMLRPKLDALRRQVVTVEERIREVSLMRDELLEEAVLDHRALIEQIHLSSDRRLGALTLDLEQLMRDVALIHDLIQQLAPAQQGPQTPTAVWALLSRYDELSNACHQLADKRFKTSVEESAGDLRQEVGNMRWPSLNMASLPKGSRHVRSASPSKADAVAAADGDGLPQAAASNKDPSAQVDEMRSLLQVKDQMVWMMLEERRKMQDEKRGLEKEVETLTQSLQDKSNELEALEKGALEEAEKWKLVCEGYEARLSLHHLPPHISVPPDSTGATSLTPTPAAASARSTPTLTKTEHARSAVAGSGSASAAAAGQLSISASAPATPAAGKALGPLAAARRVSAPGLPTAHTQQTAATAAGDRGSPASVSESEQQEEETA